jgi:hypothetical protein
MSKPNFENQESKKNKYKQLKRYSTKRNLPEKDLTELVSKENLESEYLNDKN